MEENQEKIYLHSFRQSERRLSGQSSEGVHAVEERGADAHSESTDQGEHVTGVVQLRHTWGYRLTACRSHFI